MIIITALGIALGYFIVRLMLRIGNNVIVGRTYRQALRAELSSLRLGRMLSALGINRELYLHQQKTRDIHQHMQRCRECDNSDVCDEQLCEKNIDVNDINYCNNAEPLKSIVAKQATPGD
jgi:hypothetical protein